MKHAFLILAHNNWPQLKELIQALDDEDFTLFIHIDKRAKSFCIDDFKDITNLSRVYFFSEFKCYWGGYSLVESELLLLKKASQIHFDYYHLLSGSDYPIKSNEYIKNFFELHNGNEFVHFDTDERLAADKELYRRTALFHWLQNYRKRFKHQWMNNMFTFFEHCLLGIQTVLRVNRVPKDVEIYYGSQWFSITDGFVTYVLSQEKFIKKLFSYTSCSDELVFQTLIMRSDFKENLFIKERTNSLESNMRMIDWKRGSNGSPYVWQQKDIEELKVSSCLFARKFSNDIPTALKRSIFE